MSLKFNIPFVNRLVFFVAMTLSSFGSVLAQTAPCESFDSYIQLDSKRNSVQKSITELEGRIKVLKDKIGELESFEIELADTNKRINELTSKASKTDEEQQQLQTLNYDKSLTEGRIRGLNEGKTTNQLKDELKQQESEYPQKLAELQCINGVLSKWLSPEGNFKFWMSAIFAILISLVIAGFFWTALKDEKVRQAVFAGQVGLQFIALFSIVIAIILFGITGILEAKELSALLGSLAGYILGRTMSNRNGSSDGGSSAGTEGTGGGNSGSSGDFASKIASIKVNPASIELNTNKPTEKLTVILLDAAGKTLIPPTGTPGPKWKSSDTTVATVDSNGVVTRLINGNATITAEFNGKTATCAVECN